MTIPSAEKFFDVRITSRVEFADDLWMIRVDPGSQDFHFAPGQYATLGVDNGQGLIERAYSIVSSPYEREIEFFFELVPQGELTPLLYKLGPGDTVKARKVAKGRFTLDTVSGRTNHLLLATVTGVAPYVSYVRALRKDASRRQVRRRAQAVHHPGRQPVARARLLRRARAPGRGAAVADLRADDQPAVGRSGVDRERRVASTTSSASTPTSGRSTPARRAPTCAATRR